MAKTQTQDPDELGPDQTVPAPPDGSPEGQPDDVEEPQTPERAP